MSSVQDLAFRVQGLGFRVFCQARSGYSSVSWPHPLNNVVGVGACFLNRCQGNEQLFLDIRLGLFCSHTSHPLAAWPGHHPKHFCLGFLLVNLIIPVLGSGLDAGEVSGVHSW